MDTKKFDDFLANPIKNGVYKLILDFDEEIIKKLKGIERLNINKNELLENINDLAVGFLLKYMSYLSLSDKNFEQKINKREINKIKRFITELKIDFEDIKTLCQNLKLNARPLNQYHCDYPELDIVADIWQELYFKDYHDVLFYQSFEMEGDKIRLILHFSTKKLLKSIKNFFLTLLKNYNIEKIQSLKIHKYEDVILIYPSILSLSLSEKDSSEFGLVIDDLNQSLNYYFNSPPEFRISCIFSGIALEEQIVFVYENEAKKKALDIPLGTLLQKFEKDLPTFKIPDYIKEEIKQAINIRNSSVHRSPRDIEFFDAINIMIAPTMLYIWYFKKKGIL